MKFVWEKLDKDLPELKVSESESGRFYTTPEGNSYPSVTTVLGKVSDTSWLKEWEDRVGVDEARRITAQAGRRGTAVHDLAEKYLKNDLNYTKGHMPSNKVSFEYIRPILDQNITKIYGLELPLYSDSFRIAGRVDGFVQWNGINSILDFKTSKRTKDKEDITGYFLQTSCYSYMVYERLGIIASNLVIVMTVDDAEPQVFIENARNWLPKFKELRGKVQL